MKLKNILAFGLILSHLFCFSALANTCPKVKDITIKCTDSTCNYYADTLSGIWVGNNKNPSHELLSFRFVHFSTSGENNSALKGKINYCTYQMPNSKKNLRLFLQDKLKYWNISSEDSAWKKVGVGYNNNSYNHSYVCCGKGNVEKCQFSSATMVK